MTAINLTPTDFLIDSIRTHNLTNQNVIEVKFPCGICNYEVKHNNKAILCSTCDKWIHIKCNGISIDEYKIRLNNNRDNPDLTENEIWECLKCITKKRAEIFPFGFLNNFEIENINTLDSIHLADLIPEFEIFSDALQTNNGNSNDIDENIDYNINSRYYTCQEFFKINNNNNSFKIHHTNVNGYSCHVDTLKEFFVQSKVDFDAICISETSLQLFPQMIY